MRNLRISSILLLMLLNINQGLIAKEGDELIGKPAPEWGDAEVDEFATAQAGRISGQGGSHPLVDGDMPILCR